MVSFNNNERKMQMKLVALDCSDFKRIKAVHLEFNENGLTIIGGGNKQGKTSVLDAILYALGGEKYRPLNMKREGSLEDGFIRLTFDDGMIVERSGKNAALKVIDSNGKKQGQELLNALISKIAIDLPRFLNAGDGEKAKVLLDLLGIGDELKALDQEEADKYQERTLVGRQFDQKDKAAKELPFYADVPDKEVSSVEISQQLGEMMKRNAAIKASIERIESNKVELGKLVARGEKLTVGRDSLESKAVAQKNQVSENSKQRLGSIEEQIKELLRQKELVVAETDKALKYIDDTVVAQRKAFETQIKENESAIDTLSTEILKAENIDTSLEDTSHLEQALKDCEDTNAKVRANHERQAKIEEAVALKKEYDKYTAEIENVRQRRMALLDGANLPYPGLSVKDFGKGPVITLNGIPWSDCSGSEQLIVSAAIAFAIKPTCMFVLMDKFEQFDQKSVDAFDAWLKSQQRQVITTRVSTGKECSCIIEDGYVLGQENCVINKGLKPAGKQKGTAEAITLADTPPVAPQEVCEGVKVEVSPIAGAGSSIVVDKAPSSAMSKAMELLARKRQSIMAQHSAT